MPFHYPEKPGVENGGNLVEKLIDAMVIAPLAQILAWILGGDRSDWDTLDEVQRNFIPALIKLPLRALSIILGGGSVDGVDGVTQNNLLGQIPVIGPLVQAVTGIANAGMNFLAGFFGGFKKATAGRAPGNGEGVTPEVQETFAFQSATANTASVAADAALVAKEVADEALVSAQATEQQLAGIIGYGCRYMASSPGVTTAPKVMPFDSPIGPVLGVESLAGGRYRLLSKGLWRMEAQVMFESAPLAPPMCYMDITVRNPSGGEYARLRAQVSNDARTTVTNVMPVVVPAAGYTVEVQAWTSSIPLLGGNWRTVGGGYSNTRFSVFKISDETS